ncbi:MAG: TetR family transcriptional regulator [Rhodococcus sp. (in: high G+C Gram-positive bacteria)]|uniref:TetR/AcrR family transcriptional regulator n=1 Tax=Rhodococcus sp. TaxID=1831 RepID=UPI003BAED9C2
MNPPTTGSAKPTSSGRKSEATQERLLFAAAEVLSRKGVSETRLTDIAEVAGLRAPAVYYYFASRYDLISEVMSVGQSRLREHVAAALDSLPSETNPMDRICAAVAAHLEVELELSHFATAVTRNTGQLPDGIRERLREDSHAYSTLWRELMDAAFGAGEIRDDLDLRTARKLVIGALNWAPEWWRASEGSLADLVATTQSLIRHGLSPT